MRTRARNRGFSVAELTIAMALMAVLMMVLYGVLQMMTRAWYRTSSRDDALQRLRDARQRLVADLANSSSQEGQFAATQVPSHLSGYDGDALTFLSSDDGTQGPAWSAGDVGQCLPAAQITWYLVVPTTSDSTSGAADADGYEQQCPYKWLIRRVDTSLPAPTPPNNLAIISSWTSWLTQPLGLALPAGQQVLDTQLFEFRVLRTAPLWTVRLSAVAIRDARRKLALGRVPLRGTPYLVTQQFSVPAHN